MGANTVVGVGCLSVAGVECYWSNEYKSCREGDERLVNVSASGRETRTKKPCKLDKRMTVCKVLRFVVDRSVQERRMVRFALVNGVL